MINLFNIFQSTNVRTGLQDYEKISAADEEGDPSVIEGQINAHELSFRISRVILIWLATTFPSSVHFFPMPKATNTRTSYYLSAINPYRLIPNPSKHGETGLVCKSKSCKARPTHSTIYFESQYKHLVGVKCPIDPHFTRTYNRELFKSEIQRINRSPIVVPGSIDRTMNINRMLNGPATPPHTQPMRRLDVLPTPPPSQLMSGGNPPASAAECNGVDGTIASGHQTRKNAGCAVNACKACCLKINKGNRECRIHKSMARRLQKEIRENGRVSIESSQPNVINLASSSTAPTSEDNVVTHHAQGQGARSHGVRPFQGRVKMSFLDEFRTKSLQQEAEERRRLINVENASRSIALVVWPGSKDDPLGSWGGIVHATSWPHFSLDQSVDIKKLVSDKLGADWKGNLQVWNDEHQIWLHTPMDIMVTYPAGTRKLLVIFPGIKPSSCKDVERHLASVSTGRHKDAMNLTAFIQRTHSVTPKKGNYKRVINLRSPSESDDEPQSPLLPNNHRDIELDTNDEPLVDLEDLRPPQNRNIPPQKKRVRSASIQSSEIGQREQSDESVVHTLRTFWSDTATMAKLIRMHDLTLDTAKPKKLSIKAAFRKVFGDRFNYAPSTMSHYCRWCKEINPKRLAAYIAQHGNIKVAEARENEFPKEWRTTDTRLKESDSHPAKRVKL
ncbi:hypothetical protein DFH28DRAFT_1228138 [Melampsora americana]|nr:hypothetical protein DFH28DRAFT_1228138 [Melampsora americana]